MDATSGWALRIAEATEWLRENPRTFALFGWGPEALKTHGITDPVHLSNSTISVVVETALTQLTWSWSLAARTNVVRAGAAGPVEPTV
jgi:hypothetical protein